MAKKEKNVQETQSLWEPLLMASGACFWIGALVIFLFKLIDGGLSIYATYQDAKDHFAAGRDSVVIYRNGASSDDWIFSNATIEVVPRKEND